MKKAIAGLLTLFMLFTITGCDNSSEKTTQSNTTENYFAEDAKVHIHGEGIDITLSNEDFKTLDLKEVETTNVDSAGNTVITSYSIHYTKLYDTAKNS